MFPTRLLALLAALALAPGANALTYTVTNLSDSGAGSLRQAVLDANANAGYDEIQFAVNGTILLTSGEIVISDAVTISGPGASRLTVSGNNASRVFRLDSTTPKNVTINSMTITGGSASGNGGAILNQGGNLDVGSVRIVGNTATGEGGAIYNQYNGGGNELTIDSSEISQNSANKEGAIYFIGYILRISQSTIANNTAADSVGAILLQFAEAEIRNSTIVGNSANFVGGIQSQDSTLTLESTILAGNTDSTGVNDINRTGSGTVNATYSLFQEDVNATSVINGTNTSNLVGVAPQLAPLQYYGGETRSMIPIAGSPAIGAGTNTQGYSLDQRGAGFPRDAG
ncbi:MAG TPA: choice-of-anchor Q domain-containing protein, partial [Pirellulaceae bacterium]|nr:choice-of-anchor Q domain-containing protein [Pirellulaceae bacterium]